MKDNKKPFIWIRHTINLFLVVWVTSCNLNRTETLMPPSIMLLAQLEVSSIHDITWAPDGTKFAVSTSDGNTYYIELYETKDLQMLWRTETNWVSEIAYSPNGKHLATSPYPGHIYIWDAANGTLISDYFDVSNCETGSGISFTPDGTKIITAHTNETDSTMLFRTSIYTWDVNTGRCLGEFTSYEGWLHKFDISSDGQYLVAALGRIQADNSFQVLSWDLKNPQTMCKFRGKVFYFSSTGEIIIPSIDEDSKIEFWNPSTCKLSRLVEGIEYPEGVAMSPNGQFLFTGRDKIIVWNTSNGTRLSEVNELPNSPQWVKKLSISSNGRYLLAIVPKAKNQDKDALVLWELKP